MSTYRDRTIECTDTEIRISWYYLWGAKRIPYSSIRSVQRFDVNASSIRYRIWGTDSFTYWANLDSARPRKKVGFFLDLGKRARPLLTPDDPDAFERAMSAHIQGRPAA